MQVTQQPTHYVHTHPSCPYTCIHVLTCTYRSLWHLCAALLRDSSPHAVRNALDLFYVCVALCGASLLHSCVCAALSPVTCLIAHETRHWPNASLRNASCVFGHVCSVVRCLALSRVRSLSVCHIAQHIAVLRNASCVFWRLCCLVWCLFVSNSRVCAALPRASSPNAALECDTLTVTHLCHCLACAVLLRASLHNTS